LAETPEKEPEAEALNKATQLDKEPAVLNRRSSRMPAIVVSSLALVVIGAVAIYALPKFNIALPNFSSVAELFPRETASAPIYDPAVSATLKDIQSAQQQNAAALQEDGAVLQQNIAMLQQGAATLESLRQGFTTQQTNLKTISNQLSSLIARVDSLQNAVTPLTTSSIPQPSARARLGRTSRKRTSRPPNEPVGPVSVRGAPLNPAPAPGAG
jgi:cell division protein FtsB